MKNYKNNTNELEQEKEQGQIINALEMALNTVLAEKEKDIDIYSLPFYELFIKRYNTEFEEAYNAKNVEMCIKLGLRFYKHLPNSLNTRNIAYNLIDWLDNGLNLVDIDRLADFSDRYSIVTLNNGDCEVMDKFNPEIQAKYTKWKHSKGDKNTYAILYYKGRKYNVLNFWSEFVDYKSYYTGKDYYPYNPIFEKIDNISIILKDKYNTFCLPDYLNNDPQNDYYVNPNSITDEIKEKAENDILFLLDKMTSNNNLSSDDKKQIQNYLLCWIADIVQNPQATRNTCIVLLGPQGSGKGTLSEILKLVLGTSNACELKDSELGKFNSGFGGKLLVILNETRLATEENKDHLKMVVGSSSIRVEPKGLDAYTCKNYASLLLTTNNKRVLSMIEDSERRLAIIETDFCQEIQTEEERKKFASIYQSLDKKDPKSPQYARACFDYFCSISLDDYNYRRTELPQAIKLNNAKIKDNRDPLVQTLISIIKGDPYNRDCNQKIAVLEEFEGYDKNKNKNSIPKLLFWNSPFIDLFIERYIKYYRNRKDGATEQDVRKELKYSKFFNNYFGVERKNSGDITHYTIPTIKDLQIKLHIYNE